MNKKLFSIALVLTILLQLSFPVYAIIKSNESKNGETYKIKLNSWEYHNSLMGGSVYVTSEEMDEYWLECSEADEYIGDDRTYCIITTGEDGFANFEFVREKPSCDNYISSNEYDPSGLNFYGDENYHKLDRVEYIYLIDYETEKFQSQICFANDDMDVAKIEEIYMEVSIDKGKMIRLGYYVNGQRIEDFLQPYIDEHKKGNI